MVKEVKIKVVGHRMIPFGELTNATGSANTPKLRLYFNSEWDGMSKTAKFTDARGNDAETTDIVDMTLQEDYSYLLEVPASVLQYEGDAQLTIVGTVVDGTSATTRITTIPLAFSVQDSGSWRVAWNNEQPEATVAEQVLAIVHDAEAYARGTVDGVDVPSGATGYRDNAKYYKEQASASAEAAAGAAVTAGNQAAAALGYRNGAQTFASRASGFAATAEAGKIAAETAQGKAEDAQSAAEGSRTIASQAAIDADGARYDAVVAQGKAESAQEKAEAAQTAAEDAQTAAETAQDKAEDAQTAAETAQGKAEDAQTAAETAQNKSENAQSAAETAQGLAETAQAAAAASASDALASSQTAQAWAEGKRGDAGVPSTDPAYHNNAKYWSEQAAATLASKYEKPTTGIPTADLADGAVTTEKLSDDVNERICSAYPSETQSGESILHTDIGADGVPVKSLTATVTSGTLPVTLTLKKMGKNLFGATNTLIYGKTIDDSSGEIVSSPSSCVAAEYIQVLPDTTYSFSLAWPGNYGYRLHVRFYSLDKRYLSGARSPIDSTLTFKTPAECYWVRFIVPQWCHSKYVNDPNEGDIGTFRSQYKPQLELGAESAYEAYTEQDYSITVTERNTPTELSASVITRLGENVFQLQRIDGITATMSVTYRCDPTLAYDKLKAAIVAAGTT